MPEKAKGIFSMTQTTTIISQKKRKSTSQLQLQPYLKKRSKSHSSRKKLTKQALPVMKTTSHIKETFQRKSTLLLTELRPSSLVPMLKLS
jgi:hypothetical protein